MRVLPFKISVSKINNNLYLGSIEDAFDANKLSSLQITHILNMAHEIPNFHDDKFTYKKINGRDIPAFQMHRHFEEVADFIHQNSQKGKVFVHCFCGISRSTTAIIAYMIKYQGMEPTKAYELIRKKRWIVYPNEGFMKQLKEYFKIKVSQMKINGNQNLDAKNEVKGNFVIKKVENKKYASPNNVVGHGVKTGKGGVGKSVNKENVLDVFRSTGKIGGASKLLTGGQASRNCFRY